MEKRDDRASRRAVLTGATTLAAATAVNAVAITASRAEDAELRGLWAEYLPRAADWEVTYDAMCLVREPIDAELAAWRLENGNGDWREFDRLSEERGLGPLSDAWNVAYDRMAETIERIRANKATSLFGIAVKLAALERCRLRARYRRLQRRHALRACRPRRNVWR